MKRLLIGSLLGFSLISQAQAGVFSWLFGQAEPVMEPVKVSINEKADASWNRLCELGLDSAEGKEAVRDIVWPDKVLSDYSAPYSSTHKRDFVACLIRSGIMSADSSMYSDRYGYCDSGPEVPLAKALLVNDVEMAQFLLDQKANPLKVRRYNQNCLDRSQSPEMLELMIPAYKKTGEKLSSKSFARHLINRGTSAEQAVACAQVFLKHGLDVNEKFSLLSSSYTPLTYLLSTFERRVNDNSMYLADEESELRDLFYKLRFILHAGATISSGIDHTIWRDRYGRLDKDPNSKENKPFYELQEAKKSLNDCGRIIASNREKTEVVYDARALVETLVAHVRDQDSWFSFKKSALRQDAEYVRSRLVE